MEVILKFFENDDYKGAKKGGNENEVISRTMLKIAVVSRHFRQKHGDDAMPQDGELWRCKIVKEINSGKNKGCFIVEPLEKLDDQSITHLIPGWYDIKSVNGRLIVIPRKRGINWILPLTHKRLLSDEHGVYCVIVTLDAIPVAEVPDDVPMPAPAVDDE